MVHITLKIHSVFVFVFAILFSSVLQGQEVFPNHPRLMFRDSAWGERSITTAQLRARAADPRYRAYVNRLTYSSANLAFKALILEDSTAAAECVKMLQTAWAFDQTTTNGELVMWAALAFDWLYPSPFVSSTAKTSLATRLAQGADYLISEYSGQGTHVFHTRMYAFRSRDRDRRTGAQGAPSQCRPLHPVGGFDIHPPSLPGPPSPGWFRTQRDGLWPTLHDLAQRPFHERLVLGDRAGQVETGAPGAGRLGLARGGIPDLRPPAGQPARALCRLLQPHLGALLVPRDRGTGLRLSGSAGTDYLNYLFQTQAVQSDNRVVEEGNAYNVFLWWDADQAGSTFTPFPTGRFSGGRVRMVFWRSAG